MPLPTTASPGAVTMEDILAVHQAQPCALPNSPTHTRRAFLLHYLHFTDGKTETQAGKN